MAELSEQIKGRKMERLASFFFSLLGLIAIRSVLHLVLAFLGCRFLPLGHITCCRLA